MSKKYPAAYVIKPSGEAQNIKRLLFVGREDDGKDIIHVLRSYKAAYSDTVKVFQLQRRVRGVEVAVGAFFNGHQFMMPINVNFDASSHRQPVAGRARHAVLSGRNPSAAVEASLAGFPGYYIRGMFRARKQDQFEGLA